VESAGADPAWSLLSTHGRTLLVIARDPRARMRDIAAAIGVTERTAQRVVTDLVAAGYVLREHASRRNVYTIRTDLPFEVPGGGEVHLGDLLASLTRTTPAAPTSPSAT